MTPLDTLQTYLDRNSAAIMAGDFATYHSGIDLPFMLVTGARNILIGNDDELHSNFDGFVATIRQQRVTDFIRLATSAIPVTEALISGAYETEMLSHGRRVLMPYPSRIAIRLGEGIWRAAVVVNPLINPQWPHTVPTTNPNADPNALRPDPERPDPVKPEPEED